MKTTSSLVFLTLILFASAAARTSAQVATGVPPFSSVGGGTDAIDLVNLNSHITVPVLHKPGRGMNFTYDLSYDTSVWYPVVSGGTTTWQPVQNWGWRGQTEVATGFTSASSTVSGTCTVNGFTRTGQITLVNWNYHDTFGVSHPFSGSAFINTGACTNYPGPSSTGFAAQSTDGSGYSLTVVGSSNSTSIIQTTKARNGSIANGPYNTSTGAGTAVDRNGNMISVNSSGVFTDTVGTTALTVAGSGTPTSPVTFTYNYLKPDGTTGTAAYTVNYKNYAVRTGFGCSGVGEFGPTTVSLVDNIQLPNNGPKFTFQYELTPDQVTYPNDVTGRLKTITLPTGGTVTYSYTGSNDGANCADGSTLNLTRAVYDGTATNTWTYARSLANSTTTMTAPQLPYDSAANVTVLTFDSNNHETSRKIYQGAATGTPLRTINTTWATNKTPATQVTILEDGVTQSEIDTSYDSYGSGTTINEYDWGNGTHGALLRTTTTSYLSGTPHFVTQTIVSDGAGVRKSRTDATYDSTSLTCVTGVIQHDDTNYGCSFTARGNPTTVTTYTDAATPTGAITKNSYYDSLGNLRQADLDCCQQKVWSYSTVTQYAWPDSETCGASGGPQTTTSKTYHLNTGLVVTATDENSKVTTYSYDFLLRQTNVARPDGSNVATSHDDVAHTTTVTNPIDGTNQRRVTTYFDGLGSSIKQTTFDVSGTSYSIVESQFDAIGRTYRNYNPHNSTRQYYTETRYDALGRVVKAVLQDGNQSVNSYALNTITTTDPAGKQRKLQSNALGRVTVAFEPDIANNNLLTQQSSFAYNVMGSVTSTTQGSLTRTYNFDGLNRLTSEVSPESGTISYQYNNFGLRTQRTDSRGVITTFTYDTLNRPTGISYNVGTSGVPATPSVTYSYGTNSAQNNIGRMISMTDGVGSEAYAYDVMGRTTQLQKVISGTTYTTAYAYNQDDQITSETYPSGRVVQSGYDAIGRPISVSNGGTNYISGETYDPAQHVTGFIYANGVTASFGFTVDRMLRQSVSYTKSGQTLFGLSYGYAQNGGNNGQMMSITDSVDSGRSVTNAYDALARLTQATTTGSTNYPKWGLSFAYDRFGSRTNQTQTFDAPPSNSVGMATNSNLIITPVPPYRYEARGGLTGDGSNTLTYDAENRLITNVSGATTNYSFDGNNLRVKKASGSTSTVYVFSGGRVLAEYDNGAAPASPSREYTYAINQLLSTISGGTTTYHLRDHLSIRVNTDSSGNVIGQQGHYPFGESWYSTGTSTKWAFTSYERDAESGNDYALHRFYVNRIGRFSGPDAVRGDSGNPQSLNRYAYVVDDPINGTDPTGDDRISDISDPSARGPDLSGNPDLATMTGTRGGGDPITLSPFPGLGPPPPASCGEGGNCGYPIIIIPPPEPEAKELASGMAECSCHRKGGRYPFLGFCTYKCWCDEPLKYDHTPTIARNFHTLLVEHVKEYGYRPAWCPEEIRGSYSYEVWRTVPLPGVQLITTFYEPYQDTFVSKTPKE